MNRTRVHPGIPILLGAALVLIPIPWLLAWMAAVAAHELSHILAVRLLGYEIRGFQIKGTGMMLQTDVTDPVKTMICAMAGPLGGLALLILRRVWPMAAICGIIHALFNLLPIRPLDGGTIVECGLRLFLKPENAESVLSAIEFTFRTILLFLAVCALAFWGFGAVPLFLILLFFRRRKKYLANNGGSLYNSNSYG